MEKYKILGLFWGPVGLALGLSIFFYWSAKPDLKAIKVPSVPQVYRNIPMVKFEQPKYTLGHTPVKSEGFLPSIKPLTIRTHTLELRSILRIGRRKICKINEMWLKEGQRIGPFKLIFIGENYVELYNGKKIRLLVGERLSF